MMAVQASKLILGFCQNNGSANYKSVWAFPETFPFMTFSCHSTNLDVRVIPESFCFGIWYLIGIWTNCDDSFEVLQSAKCEGDLSRARGGGFKTWLELVYLFNFLNCRVTGKVINLALEIQIVILLPEVYSFIFCKDLFHNQRKGLK